MKLALTEVYEVATFYAHFDVVKEGETPPPPVTVRVCDSLSCAMAGADHLLDESAGDARRRRARRARALHGRLRSRAGLRGRPCAGDAGATPDKRCSRRKRTRIAHALHARHATSSTTSRPAAMRCWRECLTGKRTRDDLITIVSDAGLRGLGGAGFPTGRKWSLVRAETGPRLMAVNGDEGEPGTFKDRHYLDRDPHRFLEGMLIAAWVVEAAEVYIYLRDEYPELRLMLLDEIDKIDALASTSTPRSICGAAPAPTSAAKNPR